MDPIYTDTECDDPPKTDDSHVDDSGEDETVDDPADEPMPFVGMTFGTDWI